MPQEKLPSIDAEHLPLDVRECLMRGQHQMAVTTLAEVHALSEEEANQLIEDYRQNLRERKLVLDIQVMNDEFAKESHTQQLLWWRWGGYAALLVLCLILISLMATVMSKMPM